MKEIVKKDLPESTGKVVAVFGDSVFRLHTVQLPHCNGWSWDLLAEVKGHARVSAASTSNDTQRSETAAQLRAEEAEQEKEKVGQEEVMSEGETCTELPLKESGEERRGWENREESRQKKNPNFNLWGFHDLAATPDEMLEGPEEKPKDKSVRRRFITWLDDLIHEYYRRKISKTYKRERQEGDEFYYRKICSLLFSPALFASKANFDKFYPISPAQRERQKREKWLRREKQRQKVKRHLDAYWEEKRKAKEALREKEEERFERWATEHDFSLPDSTTQGSKMRMSLWRKRFLRVKEFLYC
ncbi:transcription initiation factor TFIID subunit 3-like isoform X2 [Kryptolebias marmoratus]|uniref:transcription initiation factor TFIID subunit 3-like isoform X2 n=1 Tax=Kryptolebias marmoratus TaxID=37003 RepID=UPI0018AD0479|nr:transcription initiation factor TFIID subunit 3-like isoform X2 [Kryptolebias marmoratus]